MDTRHKDQDFCGFAFGAIMKIVVQLAYGAIDVSQYTQIHVQ